MKRNDLRRDNMSELLSPASPSPAPWVADIGYGRFHLATAKTLEGRPPAPQAASWAEAMQQYKEAKAGTAKWSSLQTACLDRRTPVRPPTDRNPVLNKWKDPEADRQNAIMLRNRSKVALD
jgi:hypothetical protein